MEFHRKGEILRTRRSKPGVRSRAARQPENFDWTTLSAKPGRDSRWLIQQESGTRLRATLPLDSKPPIHRVLASLETSESSIRAFARQHGLLGKTTYELQCNSGETVFAEPFLDWFFEISALKLVVALWDAFRTEAREDHLNDATIKTLAFCLPRNEDPHFFDLPTIGRQSVSRDTAPDTMYFLNHMLSLRLDPRVLHSNLPRFPALPRVSAAEAKLLAREVLLKAIDYRLAAHTHSAVAGLTSDGGHGSVHVVANNLLGAIYLSLVRETGALRVCEQCGRSFPGRSRAKFCSDACKQKAYRRAKRRA